MIVPDSDVLCVDGCRRIATDERLVGITRDGDEIAELVCVQHACEAPLDGGMS